MTSAGTRVAIIGCGWAGSQHADELVRNGAELAWAVDTESDRATAVAARHPPARSTGHVRDALDDSSVDAVDICLPHILHASVAVAAARAGKHVLVEKPLAHTLGDADEMIEAARTAGVVLMVAENVRFEPTLIEAARLVSEGAIGEPALVQISREAYLRESFLRDRPWFLDEQAAAGGIMMSGGIHDFEKLRMVVSPSGGEIVEVSAQRARQRFGEMEGDDTSVATARFENGAVAVLVESFIAKSAVTASGPEVHRMRVDGDYGSLVLPDYRTLRLYSEQPEFRSPAGAPAEHERVFPETNSFGLEIAHFLECVRTGQEPLTSGRSQRRALELVLAAYESMRSGQAVRV